MPANRPSKTPPAAVSATTFAVLVAMAAATAIGAAGPVSAQTDVARGLTGQRESVAAMAAAVAAVARDLRVEPSSTALPALMPAVAMLLGPETVVLATTDRPVLAAGPPLAERLLDLPPPIV